MGASYPVLSTHYSGPPFVKCIPTISLRDRRSRQLEPPTVSSYPYGLSTPIIAKAANDELVAIMRTANNKFVVPYQDFVKYGHFSPQVDDLEMDGWISNANDNYPMRQNNGPIDRLPSVAYIEGIEELGLRMPHKNDTQVALKTKPRVVEAVNPNEMGIYVSKARGNLYHKLRKGLLFDEKNELRDEIVEWFNFLSEKGFDVEKASPYDIIGTGVEGLGESPIAAYNTARKYLVVDKHFHEKTKALMSRLGFEDADIIEAMEIENLEHELRHAFVKIPGTHKDESLQGRLAKEFYSRRANLYKGTRREKIYRALAQEGEAYERSHDKISIARLLTEGFEEEHDPFDDLEAKFVKEAIEMGYKGSALAKHVEDRFENTVGQMFPEKQHSNRNSSKNLEGIVERSKSREKSNKSAYSGSKTYDKSKSSKSEYKGRQAYQSDKSAYESEEAPREAMRDGKEESKQEARADSEAQDASSDQSE